MNTPQSWIEIIKSNIPAIIAALIALLSYLSSKKNSKAIQEVHLSLNSRLDDFIKTAKEIAHAAGVREGEGRVKKPDA